MKKSNNGFTLLELMIVLVIAAILLALAIPSFSNLIRNSRFNDTVDSFSNAINFARTEALSKGKTIHIGPRTGTDWDSGTAVWLDANGDNAYDPGEELRLWDKLPASQSLAPTPAVDYFIFRPTGLANQTINFDLCEGSTGEQGRQLSLTLGGSVSTREFTCI